MGNYNLFNIENHNHLNLDPLKWLNPFNWFKWLRKGKLTKDTVRILFVDDMFFPIVDSLERAGYNVTRKKDIKDVDDSELKDRHIIFVDYDGVGKNFSMQHQGASLVSAIKDKYGATKFVVLYTDQVSIPTATSMSSLFKAADAHMKKSSSDTSDFITKISEGLAKINE